MKTYTVKVKQVYTYEGVEAESEQEAVGKVIDGEWNYSDDELETSAEIEEEEE